MRSRGQDSEDVDRQRLAAAREEMSHYDEFDYVIVNEDFETAVDEMCSDLHRQPPAPGRAAGRATRALIAALLGSVAA